MLVDIIKSIKPSIVLVVSSHGGAGTGFIVHSDGYILTCNHVLGDSITGAISIPFDGNPRQLYFKKVASGGFDIALIKVDESNLRSVKLDYDFPIEEGIDIATCGFPFIHLGLNHLSTTKGIISAIIDSSSGDEVLHLYQIDAMVHEGNSGGPCFLCENGKVIGIISSRFDPLQTILKNVGKIEILGQPLRERTNIGFVVPITYARDLLNRIPT